jgi:hypothetical protein
LRRFSYEKSFDSNSFQSKKRTLDDSMDNRTIFLQRTGIAVHLLVNRRFEPLEPVKELLPTRAGSDYDGFDE